MNDDTMMSDCDEPNEIGIPADHAEPDYWVCTDCLMVIVNADDSGVPDDLVDAVHAGVERIGNVAYVGDENTDHDFSSRRCNCCLSTLGGARHAVGEIN